MQAGWNHSPQFLHSIIGSFRLYSFLHIQNSWTVCSSATWWRHTRTPWSGNSVNSPSVRHCRRCALIADWLYVTLQGSLPASKLLANAMAYRPQSDGPCCFATFMTCQHSTYPSMYLSIYQLHICKEYLLTSCLYQSTLCTIPFKA